MHLATKSLLSMHKLINLSAKLPKDAFFLFMRGKLKNKYRADGFNDKSFLTLSLSLTCRLHGKAKNIDEALISNKGPINICTLQCILMILFK